MKKSILFIVFLAFCSFSYGQSFEYSFMEEYNPEGVQFFTLSTSDGFIDVKPSENGKISVYYRVEKGGDLLTISREELEKDVELMVLSSEDALKITVRNRDAFRWSDWKNRLNVSCEVFLPPHIACNLRTSDGDIRIREMEAAQNLRTSDGDINAVSMNGDLDAITSDGDIHAEEIRGKLLIETSDGDIKAMDVDGDAIFTTSDGDIRIKRVSGLTEATTSDGDILFEDLSGGLSAVTSDGDVTGNFLNLKRKVIVATSDGDIELKIPADTALDLTMKGEDLELPQVQLVGKISEHHIEGSINGGGIPVQLITSDGHVELSFH